MAEEGKAKRGQGSIPTLVRLSQGEVQVRASKELQKIIPKLANDAEVNLTDAIDGLVRTAGHICMRYEQYKFWPAAAWRVTEEFNEIKMEMSDYIQDHDDIKDKDKVLTKNELQMYLNSKV